MEKGKRMFTIEGNLCGERVRLGRALHKPPLTQEQLAAKVQLEGLDMTKVMISKIESGVRHVCDAEPVSYTHLERQRQVSYRQNPSPGRQV